MLFISPIWLLGLLPWAGVVLYLFIGQRQKQAVPFLQLWSGEISRPSPKRSVNLPPWFVILLILSMLLAILGAAGPSLRSALGTGEITTIILDRGITMSPGGRDGTPFRGVPAMAGRIAGPVELMAVPGESIRCDGSNWVGIAQGMSATAVDTRTAIEEAVVEKLRNSSGLVIVLTDHLLDRSDDRLVQVAPQNGVEDVGIADVAARSNPRSQVMVRLRNQSRLESVPLRITSGGQTISSVVKLPPAGETKDFFIDMPKPMDDVVAAEIEPHDDAPVNDRAWLVREKSWPVVESASLLPASVTKLIGVYSKSRPAGSGSVHILVSDHPIPEGENGVWLVPGSGDAGDSKTTVVTPHPITEGIGRWPLAANANEGLPDGFEPVVTCAGKAIVGVHQGEVRQVWVKLDLESWARTPDFVVFFANVFDWINAGGMGEFVGHRVSWVAGESGSSEYLRTGVWSAWPGLYRSADDRLRAYNAPDVKWNPPPVTHWRDKLAEHVSHGQSNASYQSWFWLAAQLCALAAVVVWGPGHP